MKQSTKTITGKSPTPKTPTSVIQSSQLMKLFEDELKDIYWVEKTLTKALPKMIKKSSSGDLIEAFENHLTETQNQVNRLEQIFDLIGKKAAAKKCLAMEGILNEAQEIMEECEEGAMRDAGIISAGQKVEHYEIATYGTLFAFAEILELTDAAKILEQTLSEEKAADAKLTEIAVSIINIEAAETEVTSK